MKTPQQLLTKTYSRKNHGINAHLKPRLYFVDYDDAIRVMKEYAKQWVSLAAAEAGDDTRTVTQNANVIWGLKKEIDAQ